MMTKINHKWTKEAEKEIKPSKSDKFKWVKEPVLVKKKKTSSKKIVLITSFATIFVIGGSVLYFTAPIGTTPFKNEDKQTKVQSAKEYLKRAVDIYNEGKYAEAIEILIQAKSEYPDNKKISRRLSQAQKDLADTYVKDGKISYENGEYEKAIELFNKALAIAPDDEEIQGILHEAQTAKATEERLKLR